jgi:type II secretory pathway pseudopilin PulG
MQPKAPPQREDGQGGYTLIEALAALAVTAAALSVIGQLGFVTVAAARRAQTQLMLASAARRAFAALPGTRVQGEGAATGELNGADWRLQYSPFAFADPAAPGHPAWTPQALRVIVTGPSGGEIVVDTVRLMPAQAAR